MRELDAGVGDQAAPVARVVATRARVDAQVEVHAAARTQEHGGALGAQARSVGGHEQVGIEQCFVGLAQLAQARRAGFLAHLDQVLGVEAQTPARVQHVGQRLQVDRVLALVVGDAAAVPAAIGLGQRPGRQAGLPIPVPVRGSRRRGRSRTPWARPGPRGAAQTGRAHAPWGASAFGK